MHPLPLSSHCFPSITCCAKAMRKRHPSTNPFSFNDKYVTVRVQFNITAHVLRAVLHSCIILFRCNFYNSYIICAWGRLGMGWALPGGLGEGSVRGNVLTCSELSSGSTHPEAQGLGRSKGLICTEQLKLIVGPLHHHY